MEVMSDNNVSDVSLKDHQETSEIASEDGVKLNGEVNGMSDGEMDNNESSPQKDDGCDEEFQTNGDEAVPSYDDFMDTDVGFVNNDSETINDDNSSDIDNAVSDVDKPVRTYDSTNGSFEVGDCSRSSVGTTDSEILKESRKHSDSVEDGALVVNEQETEENDDNGDVSQDSDVTSSMEVTGKDSCEGPNQIPQTDDDIDGTTNSISNEEPDEGNHTSEKEEIKLDGKEVSITETSSAKETALLLEKKLPRTDDSVTISLLTPTKNDDDSCTETTPDKSSKKIKKTQSINVTPRRSSRNLNKTRSYVDEDVIRSEDDDIQEVTPIDPLSDERKPKKTTIVVSDTKRLAEIAAGSKHSKGGKKEPTLVIIDTNSILAGKGGVPISSHSLNPQMTITPSQSRSPWPPHHNSIFSQKAVKVSPILPTPSVPPQPKPVILPSLTDDMYVVEAPSFIVPYVYEKPPVHILKNYLEDFEKSIKQQDEDKKKESKKESEKKRESEENEDSTKSKEEKESKDDSETKDAVAVKSEDKEDDKTDVKPEPMDIDENENKGEEENKDKTNSEDNLKKEKQDEKEEKTSGEKVKEVEIKEVTKEEKVADAAKKAATEDVLEDKTNKKSQSYFDNPLGKFFMQIGINLVQEHVQADLLKNQIRKRDREGKNCSADVHMAINSLTRTLESSKENNEPFKFELKKCQLCNFKTESRLVMAHHLETPHMRNFIYRCNFCEMEVRSPHDILFHMEAVHNVRGRLDRSPAFHQCPNCPFEDNQKGKLSRHLLSCAKKYKADRNQEPPLEWEPPAKIPRVRGARGPGTSIMYPPTLAPRVVTNSLTRLSTAPTIISSSRGRGRPPIYVQRYPTTQKSLPSHLRQGGMVFRPTMNNAQPPVLLPSPYLSTSQLLQGNKNLNNGATAKLLQQPSISITPLPRGSTAPAGGGSSANINAKPGRPPGANPSKTTFVICEICDGYIKDLEQLRNHMQWIHKVKIHPKMIYNRPPLNCQKCQFRFFTDQGLERHLLGSHGLVTSSMQEAANKGKDGGRCPVCGRVYQWKLLNHVARDHNMSLKPAHLSYKCTVCTATFGMYKQFENHVYSAHSVVAKRVIDKTKNTQPSTSQPSVTSSKSDVLLKPLKINDEITIIPQPARAKTSAKPAVTSAKPVSK